MNKEKAKSDSEKHLKANGFEINPNLPLIEDMDELTPQDATSVARRAVVLGYMIGIGHGANSVDLKAAVENYGLWDYTSEDERGLLSRDTHTAQEKINAQWLVECVQSLAWCLNLTDLLPMDGCEHDLASKFPPPFESPTEFIGGSNLRPFDEIYSQADLHYRMHWAARNARLSGAECPVGEGFIAERRKAIDWVLGVEEDWDEVPLDT